MCKRDPIANRKLSNLGEVKGTRLPFIYTVRLYGDIEVTHSGGVMIEGKPTQNDLFGVLSRITG